MRRRVLLLFGLGLGLLLFERPSLASNPRDVAKVTGGDGRHVDPSTEATRARLPFDLARIDEGVLREFEKAWNISNNGTSGREGLVLIFQAPEGGYLARVQRKTNEQKKVTFAWIPNAVAIVHTHPNGNDPRPSDIDRALADERKVPIFTITLHGMYVYDPSTKKTSRVHYGLDWLDLDKWKRVYSPRFLFDSSQRQ